MNNVRRYGNKIEDAPNPENPGSKAPLGIVITTVVLLLILWWGFGIDPIDAAIMIVAGVQ